MAEWSISRGGNASRRDAGNRPGCSVLIIHNGSAVEKRWMEACAPPGFHSRPARRQNRNAGSFPRSAGTSAPGLLGRAGGLRAAPGFPARRHPRPGRDAARGPQLFSSPHRPAGRSSPAPFAYLDAASAVIPQEFRAIAAKALRLDPSATGPATLRGSVPPLGCPTTTALALWGRQALAARFFNSRSAAGSKTPAPQERECI